LRYNCCIEFKLNIMHKNTKVILFGTIILVALFFSSITFVKAEDTIVATSTADALQLTKPAILPGGPLYFFKRLGEGFVNLFTFGKVNQAKRALELSQVRLAEGQALLEKNKIDLAQKSNEEYQTMLSEASLFAQRAQKEGKNVDGVLLRISQETLKNQQVLLNVIEKAPEQAKFGLQNAIRASVKERQQALQGLPEQKRRDVETRDFNMNEVIQNKIEELELEDVEKLDVLEDLDTDSELEQLEDEINKIEQTGLKKIFISRLIPEQGVVGSKVTIFGQGFTETNNTIKFSVGIIPNIESKTGQELSFEVPSSLDPACSFNKLPCLMFSKSVVPGKYEVSVINGNNAQSNMLSFNVIEKEVKCESSSDCGKPIICSDGKEYPAWSCNDGKCDQITYFKDPCSLTPSPTDATDKENKE